MSIVRGAAAVIPTPQQMVSTVGGWRIPALVSVAAADPELADPAGVLASSLQAASLAAVTVQVATQLLGAAQPIGAQIVLALDVALAPEAYVIDITATGAVISGGSPIGVAWGAATLVQMLIVEHAERLLPCGRISDAPQFGYRGLMVDVARHPHSLVTLKKLVTLCWFYKIRYLQLHLADVEAFAFPSVAYPQLATPGRHLTRTQWCELEAFAARHQVIIVPELDVPGHANKALRRLCPTNPPTNAPVINPVAEHTFAVLGTLIDELLEVFPRTPFIHVGADEVMFDGWAGCADCAEFLRARGLTALTEVYRHFIARMRDVVHARGRRMIVWEGFAAEGAIPIPSDVIVQFFDVEYLQPEQAIVLGHPLINSSWGPLYVVPSNATCPLPMVYQWHPGIFGGNALSCVPEALAQAPAFTACTRREQIFSWPLPGRHYPFVKTLPAHDPGIMGAMMCSWEMLEDDEVPALRRHLAAFSERTWHPAAGGGLADFLLRLEMADWRLSGLLRAVTLDHRHLLPDFGAIGSEFGPFINDLDVSPIRDDGPLERLMAPPADLYWDRRIFAGDFCDLHPELQARGRGTVWFRHRFTAPATLPVAALIGYDGPLRLWCNGEVVFTDMGGANPAMRDMEELPLPIRGGSNEVVVALDADHGKAWGIYLRLKGLQGHDRE